MTTPHGVSLFGGAVLQVIVAVVGRILFARRSKGG